MSPWRSARVDRAARSLPAPGSLNSWHPHVGRVEDGEQPSRALLVGAVDHERRPDERQTDAAGEIGRAGASEFLVVDRDLGR
jgi:hypothetical protein